MALVGSVFCVAGGVPRNGARNSAPRRGSVADSDDACRRSGFQQPAFDSRRAYAAAASVNAVATRPEQAGQSALSESRLLPLSVVLSDTEVDLASTETLRARLEAYFKLHAGSSSSDLPAQRVRVRVHSAFRRERLAQSELSPGGPAADARRQRARRLLTSSKAMGSSSQEPAETQPQLGAGKRAGEANVAIRRGVVASRRIRTVPNVAQADRASRDAALEPFARHVLARDEEREYISSAQEAHRLEQVWEKLQMESGAPPTVAQHSAAVGLTPVELQQRLARGRVARRAMVEHNLRLVASIARKYEASSGVPLSDLIQEGALGLLRGLTKFDVDRGFKFSTYCHWWIRQAITRALGDQSRTVRLPGHIYDSLTKVRKATRLLEESLGREPSTAELAAQLAWAPKKVAKVQGLGGEIQSADAEVFDSKGRSASLLDAITTKDVLNEDQYDAQFLREDLDAVLETLDERERGVLRMHYGLGRDGAGARGKPASIADIAKALGIKRQRVQQIEEAALRKLRQPSRCAVLLSHTLAVDADMR